MEFWEELTKTNLSQELKPTSLGCPRTCPGWEPCKALNRAYFEIQKRWIRKNVRPSKNFNEKIFYGYKE